MPINYFLRNEARSSQKHTFARRQWAKHFLFLFFIQHLFKSIWFQSIWLVSLFAVNILRNGLRSSQKRSFARRQWVQYLLNFFLSPAQHLKSIVMPASLMEQLNVGFLLTITAKPVIGWVILSCKSQVFSIISEFEHHFQEISLFVKSTILGKSIFEGLDGVEMWWGKKFIY